MGKKLQPKVLEDIIAALPAKERDSLKAQELSTEWLNERIAYCKGLLKRDLWFGIAWFVVYSVSLFTTGFGQLTVTIFLIGMSYFIYAIFKTGSFGLNKKRVKVYEELLKAMEG